MVGTLPIGGGGSSTDRAKRPLVRKSPLPFTAVVERRIREGPRGGVNRLASFPAKRTAS